MASWSHESDKRCSKAIRMVSDMYAIRMSSGYCSIEMISSVDYGAG